MRRKALLDDLLAETELRSGPRWQELPVGTRVRPIGQRRCGTVIEVLETRESDGLTELVLVKWDRRHSLRQQWATDCLIIVNEQEETE